MAGHARPAGTTELDLLLAIAARHLTSAPGQAPVINDAVDWELFLALASTHGLVPLVHAGAASATIPQSVGSRLRDRAAHHARHGLKLAAALRTLLNACASAGLPVAPLKGLPLAERVYGNQMSRQVRDIDILVRERDITALQPVLRSLEYTVDPSFTLRDWPWHHVAARSPEGAVVEIHRALLPPHGGRWITLEPIIDRLRPASFLGAPMLEMPPEELLVYLCEHGAGHAWSRLEWLVCVAALVRSGQVRDWAAARAHAHAVYGGTRRVDAALALAHDVMGLSLEETGTAGIGAPVRAANRAVVGRLAIPRKRETNVERLLYPLATDASFLWRVRRIRDAVLRPSEADAAGLRLPRGLAALYVLARPLRLLWRDVIRGRGGDRSK